MPRVVLPDGRDLGEIDDPNAIAYYRGEGATISDDADVVFNVPIRSDKPSLSAHKADWVTYAQSVDPDAEALEDMTKTELVEKYG